GDGLSEPERKERIQSRHSFIWRNRPVPCRCVLPASACTNRLKPSCAGAAAFAVTLGHPAWSGAVDKFGAGCDGSKTRTWDSCTRPVSGHYTLTRDLRLSHETQAIALNAPHIAAESGLFKALPNQGESVIAAMSRRRSSSSRARSRS